MNSTKRKACLSVIASYAALTLSAQPAITGIAFSRDSLQVNQLQLSGSPKMDHNTPIPLVSFILNGKLYASNNSSLSTEKLVVKPLTVRYGNEGMQATLKFINKGNDTLKLENVVPFGEAPANVYITGMGKHGLSRTHLFRPGAQPVNVIVPDNAWELGFNSITLGNDLQLAALTRRKTLEKAKRTRFETLIYPGGSVEFAFYAEVVQGDWHASLSRMFQQRLLHDVDRFDNTLFERKDLQWIRHSYVSHLIMTWDKFYYDYTDGKFHLAEFLRRGQQLYGGDEFVGLWPTWPTLGLDQRNQFDMFEDLPGGMAGVKKIAAESRKLGTKLFLCYNPWDESTRSENHFEGISRLVAATSADGMVLDTKGESSRELQDAADKVRPGVIMYSEGMAVPKDMQGIPSGRVHNALYYAPMLNLNKLIKPEFAIFRVAELYKEPIQREFATSFFNGYGVEINIFAPGQPDHAEKQYRYLGRTARIQRENTYNFTSKGYIPLIATSSDSIWVNEWALPEKTIYTIYSIIPGGFKGELFNVKAETGSHFVDLWHHRLLTPVQRDGKWQIIAETDAFHQKNLGTNNEGEVDCIAKLPMLINASRNGDQLDISTQIRGDEMRIWAGDPAYDKKPVVIKPGKHAVQISRLFGRFEGKIVIQLMDKGILLDETVLEIAPGESRRISETAFTPTVNNAPQGMVSIPAGSFRFHTTHGDEFIPYPVQGQDSFYSLASFYMDRFPVTNRQYLAFVKATGYKPADTANYLKHWIKGRIATGQEDFPVVYVSYEDAKAYAKWAGKRLPTEVEWQYAAQTPKGNEWPWDQITPVTRKEEVITGTLTVKSLEGIDSAHCNLGNGKLYKVGSYPKGENPYGLQDLVGSVWQLTNDLYMNGSYRYIMMKGGSYFKPSSSWWYVQGGPRELHYRQFLLRVSQGFERNATVGFRCVKDRQP